MCVITQIESKILDKGRIWKQFWPQMRSFVLRATEPGWIQAESGGPQMNPRNALIKNPKDFRLGAVIARNIFSDGPENGFLCITSENTIQNLQYFFKKLCALWKVSRGYSYAKFCS